MLGSHDGQYTKAEWEIIDVMCEESSKKTYCSVYGDEPKYQCCRQLYKSVTVKWEISDGL